MPEFKQNFAEIIQGKEKEITVLEKEIKRLNAIIDHMAGIQIKVLESLGYSIAGAVNNCAACNGTGVAFVKDENGKVINSGKCQACA